VKYKRAFPLALLCLFYFHPIRLLTHLLSPFARISVDPEGGLNSFVLSKPPKTYTVPATLDQAFVLPRGHYKYWVRHINAGSRLKVKLEWPSDAMLQFCLIMTSVDAYLRDSNRCILKLHSRSRLAFEYVSKHSGDHFFIVESANPSDIPSMPSSTEPFSASDRESPKKSSRASNSSSRPQRSIKSISAEPSNRVFRSADSPQVISGAVSFLDQLSASTVREGLPIAVSGFISTSKRAHRSLLLVDRDVLAADGGEEAPEFFVVKANVSFDMSLVQYDTNQADDLFVGSFSKEFEFNRPEWLVLYNPTDSHIYSVTISVTRRNKELLITVFLIEFFLISTLACCCYHRYNNVTVLRKDPENGLRLFSRKNRMRHLGDARSKSMDDVETEHMAQHAYWIGAGGGGGGGASEHLPPHLSPSTEARRARKHVVTLNIHLKHHQHHPQQQQTTSLSTDDDT